MPVELVVLHLTFKKANQVLLKWQCMLMQGLEYTETSFMNGWMGVSKQCSHLLFTVNKGAPAGWADHLVWHFSDLAGVPLSVILWWFIIQLCVERQGYLLRQTENNWLKNRSSSYNSCIPESAGCLQPDCRTGFTSLSPVKVSSFEDKSKMEQCSPEDVIFGVFAWPQSVLDIRNT